MDIMAVAALVLVALHTARPAHQTLTARLVILDTIKLLRVEEFACDATTTSGQCARITMAWPELVKARLTPNVEVLSLVLPVVMMTHVIVPTHRTNSLTYHPVAHAAPVDETAKRRPTI